MKYTYISKTWVLKAYNIRQNVYYYSVSRMYVLYSLGKLKTKNLAVLFIQVHQLISLEIPGHYDLFEISYTIDGKQFKY